MGASTSSGNGERKSRRSWTWKNGDESIVKLMLPVYYTPQGMTAVEVKQAKQAWDMINDDLSPIYLDKLCSTSFAQAYPNCKDWFLDVFYDRVFDIHPLCKPMFKSAMSKGSFIHGLLSFLFTVLSNKKEFHAKLLQIADSHCKKGVKAIEYGIIGECMFWSLEHCLGRAVYTESVHQTWVKIFSSMLRVIVPVAVAHELASNEAQKNRRFDHDAAFIYQMSDASKKEYNESLAKNNICPVMHSGATPSIKPSTSRQQIPMTIFHESGKRLPEVVNSQPIEASEGPNANDLANHINEKSIKDFTVARASRKLLMDKEHPYPSD